MTVTGGSALPKTDIDRMVREAEQHAEEDRRRREAAETRNQAEQLVYQTEKLIADNPDKIPADARRETEEALTKLKAELKAGDPAAVRRAMEQAATAAQKIGSALYARSSSGDTAHTTQDTGTDRRAAGDDVVDAEIVDDDTARTDDTPRD